MSSILLPRNGGDVVCVYTGTPTSNQYLAWDSASSTFVPTTLSAGSPGGSNTQIQYNNSGAFAGSANLVWNAGTNGLEITGSGFTASFTSADNSTSSTAINWSANGYTYLYVNATTTPAVSSLGDAADAWNSNWVEVDDNNSTVKAGNRYGKLLTLDNTNSRATYNGKFVVTSTGDYYAWDTGTSTYWKWASVNGVWTGTDTTSASLP